jgi:hypothetical protein
MTQSTDLAGALPAIQQVIDQAGEDADRFAETLRRCRIPHLSFSQITTVEFCQYRYYLEYVALVELDPVPLYFTKGKLLHQIIAAAYRKADKGETAGLEEYYALIDSQLEGDHRRHLRNAVQVHLENRWQPDAQVISVEKPFVMAIDPQLPPCVGVVDLVLKRTGAYILVDHKTGHDFFPEDTLQSAIYIEYMQNQFGDVACEFFYDHYRWVNNLGRIRKPAFQRTYVSIPASFWQTALERIRSGYRLIEQIKNGKKPARYGECFRCPYRGMCN